MANKAKKDRKKWEDRMYRLIREAKMEYGAGFPQHLFYEVISNRDLSIPEIRAKVKSMSYSDCVRRIWDI